VSCRSLSRYAAISRASRRGQHGERAQEWGERADQKDGDNSNAGGLADSGVVEICEDVAAKFEEFSLALRRLG